MSEDRVIQRGSREQIVSIAVPSQDAVCQSP